MDLFYKQTSYIIDAFESILDLINEINRKNEKFCCFSKQIVIIVFNECKKKILVEKYNGHH